MARIKIVINSDGARAILRSDEVLAELKRRAKRIADAAGDGMIVTDTIGPNRARVSIGTDTEQAKHAEATDRSLTRALDAGR